MLGSRWPGRFADDAFTITLPKSPSRAPEKSPSRRVRQMKRGAAVDIVGQPQGAETIALPSVCPVI